MTFRELQSVEDTALDAANAKCSAVARGYYQDPYAEYFIPNKVQQLPPMNLGYYARTLAMQSAVLKFHHLHGSNIQVVVLGCGYDTMFWRLRDMEITFTRYYELDLPFVIQRKGQIIRNQVFQPIEYYYLLECDLGKPGNVEKILKENDFDPSIPAVFIDECTLIYVDPDSVDTILKFAASLPSNGFISYGMIKPEDQFGKMMVQNFRSFGAPLKCIDKYPSVQSYTDRFKNLGFVHVKVGDMNLCMNSVIPREDYIRIHRLEMQDDPDELSFMLSHYVLALGSSDEDFLTILK